MGGLVRSKDPAMGASQVDYEATPARSTQKESGRELPTPFRALPLLSLS